MQVLRANNTDRLSQIGSFFITEVLSATEVVCVGNHGGVGPDPNNGSIHWKVYDTAILSGTPPGITGAIEPNWSTAVTPGDLVVDGYITWVFLGNVPNYNNIEFNDDRVIEKIPQTLKSWADTVDTDVNTAAPKVSVKSARSQFTTTTASTGQTLATLTLSDNAVTFD